MVVHMRISLTEGYVVLVAISRFEYWRVIETGNDQLKAPYPSDIISLE